jgi:hypothetical protein
MAIYGAEIPEDASARIGLLDSMIAAQKSRDHEMMLTAAAAIVIVAAILVGFFLWRGRREL